MRFHPAPEAKLSDLSAITYAYYVAETTNRRVNTLIVRFSGVFVGNGDAIFMRAVTCAGLEAWHPLTLGFDFRELSYTWGDEMTDVLDVGEGMVAGSPRRNLPTAVVVSDLCRAGLTSLLLEVWTVPPEQWLFDTVDSARARVLE
jgi:hypothetical protein